MKRSLWVVAVIGCVVALFVGWGSWRDLLREADASETATETPSAAPSGRPSSVYALGRLEPTGRVLRIAAPSGNEGNRLEVLLVKEGERVSKGQMIGRMDTYARRVASKTQEEARLATALAKLSQIRAGSKQGDIEAARAAVDSAQRDLETKTRERKRAEQLERSNAISAAELDDIRLKYQVAEAAYRQAMSRLSSISEVRDVDLAIAEAEVQSARSAVELAVANLDATQVIAPSDGTILRLHSLPGEQVATEGILELGQVERMQAVAEVFEGDIPRVRLGDLAAVVIDTTGDRLEGHVVEIGHIVARKKVLTNDPVSDTDARVIEVRIDLKESGIDWLRRLSNARVQVMIGGQSSSSSHFGSSAGTEEYAITGQK